MKYSKIMYALSLCIFIISCSSDDDAIQENLTGQKGDLVLKFDNGVGDQDFIFGTSYNKSNNESYKLDVLKYIVSNVRLTNENGNIYTYPAESNVFIIDEANGNNAGEVWVVLNDVDAANYTSISFGVGIDQDRFALGAEGQGAFLETAQDAGMLWSWATGYRFIRLDGLFSSGTVTDQALNVHMGSVGTALDNYREVNLSFPNTVRVRENIQPEVHIKADISKVFDGSTSVSFMDGYDQVHTDEVETPIIANNIMGMFEVHHVHNN